MAWHLTGDKPSNYLKPCWPSSLTHICGTRGRWVNPVGWICIITHKDVFSHFQFLSNVIKLSDGILPWRRQGPVYTTVYPKKYAHGFCFAVLCCDYTLTDFPISIRLTSLALWQSNDCPSASKATLMNMDKYFMWIHYERLHNHNKAKHNKTMCIFLGIYCTSAITWLLMTKARFLSVFKRAQLLF